MVTLLAWRVPPRSRKRPATKRPATKRPAVKSSAAKRPAAARPTATRSQAKGSTAERPPDKGPITKRSPENLPERRTGAGHYFAELVPGLEEFGRAELKRLGAGRLDRAGDGVRFAAPANLASVLRARTVTAFYRSVTFAVPRPKGILGDQAMRHLLEEIGAVMAEGERAQDERFDGFRIAAAGADSPVFVRLAEQLESGTGLKQHDDGELLLRVRPDPLSEGWEVLIRLTPRPASSRAWRVCNRPGGLNAVVAAAANKLVGVRATDRYLNLMCGSGTLLVERALAGDAQRLVGLDIDAEALECSRANLLAAGVLERCELLHADVRSAPLPEAGFDALLADPPWGDALGHKRSNRELYPALLSSAARLAAPGARFGLLTHEVRLTQGLLASSNEWLVKRELQLEHGGHHPLLLLLERSSGG